VKTPVVVRYSGILAVILVLSVVSAATADDGNGKNNAAKSSAGNDGIRFSLADSDIRFSVGGRAFNDWMWADVDPELEGKFGALPSGNEWRSARLHVTGDLPGGVEFKIEFDFAGGDADAKDIYLGIKNLPFGKLRIGHFKESFSLEQLTSGRFTTFMERSLADLFAPGRNTGAAVLGVAENMRITWGAGVFTDAGTYGEAKAHDDTYNFSARITALPWVEGPDRLLHLGVAYRFRDVQENGTLRFSQRPESHLSYRLVDTTSFSANSASVVGVEGACLIGRLSLQSEYISALVKAADYDDPRFNGFYAYGSYFLSADCRGYSRSAGAFGRVRPHAPFNLEGGYGAWEVAVRYSQLKLDNGLIEGGKLNDITLGLNWYLNANARIMANLIRAEREDIGVVNIFQMRFQFDF
jgi:phosphate-selective porin OprO/OprP